MRNPSHADLYLARLLRRLTYRVTIYTVLIVTATASFYTRIIQGRPDQRPASYLVLFCLYGFLMAAMARDPRSRVAYLSLGVLIGTNFSRSLLSGNPAAAGLIEVTSCLVLLAALRSLARDPDFLASYPVLQSAHLTPKILEDPDAQARADSPSHRDAHNEPGPRQG